MAILFMKISIKTPPWPGGHRAVSIVGYGDQSRRPACWRRARTCWVSSGVEGSTGGAQKGSSPRPRRAMACLMVLAGALGVTGGHLGGEVGKPGNAAVAAAEDVVAKELVKAGKDQEFRAGGLHLLDEGPGVAHVGHGVLNAHDVGMACGQLQHQIRAEVVAGALGEVIQQAKVS